MLVLGRIDSVAESVAVATFVTYDHRPTYLRKFVATAGTYHRDRCPWAWTLSNVAVAAVVVAVVSEAQVLVPQLWN